jgi:hypothetical protein
VRESSAFRCSDLGGACAKSSVTPPLDAVIRWLPAAEIATNPSPVFVSARRAEMI